MMEADGLTSLAIVGLAKNVGKTTTLGSLLDAAARRGLRVGLTSIGRDGEPLEGHDARGRGDVGGARDGAAARRPDKGGRVSRVGLESLIRVRIGHEQAHYAGNLVDGAHVLKLFGDVATELCIAGDGEEGLFRAYESVEFLAPVRGGDYLEVRGKVTKVGKSSRGMEFSCVKVIEADPAAVGRARVLAPPLEVCRARGTCVVGR